MTVNDDSAILSCCPVRSLWVCSAVRRWGPGAVWVLLGSWICLELWGKDWTWCSSWTWNQVNRPCFHKPSVWSETWWAGLPGPCSLFVPAPEGNDPPPWRPGSSLPAPDSGSSGAPALHEGGPPGCKRWGTPTGPGRFLIGTVQMIDSVLSSSGQRPAVCGLQGHLPLWLRSLSEIRWKWAELQGL